MKELQYHEKDIHQAIKNLAFARTHQVEVHEDIARRRQLYRWILWCLPVLLRRRPLSKLGRLFMQATATECLPASFDVPLP